MLCVSWKPECSGDDSGNELMEDTDGDACETLDDGYIALKISRFPSDEKLDALFALGRLSAFYMLKVGNGPDPVSPALLECAVNTIDSIIDMPWLEHMFKTLTPTLALLPAEHGGPMPERPGDHIKLVRIFQARMDSSVSNCIFAWSSLLTSSQYNEIAQASDDHWPQIRRDFFSSALLGHPSEKFLQSPEFRAFRDSFDVFLTPSLVSLSKV